MSISSLQITKFRNIVSANLTFAPTFNLFFGDNAAGKTSLLETLYYLGTGKSFRTHLHDRVIQYAADAFTLFSEIQYGDTLIPVGFQRSRDGSRQIRIHEQNKSSIAEVSLYLPVQFISADSYRILMDGPKGRRQFLDWGLFHTNATFYTQWREFQKILMQRNAALKARAPKEEMLAWNQALANAGNPLDASRRLYIDNFSPHFQKIVDFLLPGQHIHYDYLPGWDQELSLEACLRNQLTKEYQLGYTLHGPHRADLMLSVNDLPAQDVLSQGQQKLLSYALKLAQGFHLQLAAAKTPVYLIDDLPSELDSHKRLSVMKILADINAQVFITGIEEADIQTMLSLAPSAQMFHVKHGVISPHG